MKVFVILMMCIFLCEIKCMSIVGQVKCFNEEDCKVKFSQFLKTQKRIFAWDEDDNQDGSSIREQGKKQSFYLNLDHSKQALVCVYSLIMIIIRKKKLMNIIQSILLIFILFLKLTQSIPKRCCYRN